MWDLIVSVPDHCLSFYCATVLMYHSYSFVVHMECTPNGRIFDDKIGDITCVANDGSSVVDYMLASTSLFNSILYFQVASEDFSDHFPLRCRLLLSYESENDQSFEADLNENNWIKYKWKEESKTQFIQIFSTLFSCFKDKVTGTNESIINCLPEFVNIYKKAGEFMKVK